MTLGFDFHPEARAEFFADVDWYDDREFGVGARLEVAVREAIDAAIESPESWADLAGLGPSAGRAFQGLDRLPLPRRVLRRG
jgi:hypothetical protein